MNLQFCECRGIMVPFRDVLKCRSCGREKQVVGSDMKVVTEQSKSETIVLENDEPNLPTIERECPKCKNTQAYFWLIQTRAADEPPTQFFRCTKCVYTWRKY